MSNAENIAEVLAAHGPKWGIRDGRPHCVCGWAGDEYRPGADTHREHQAGMVAAALEPVIRERERVSNWDAWSDGHEAGFEEAKNPGAFVNDYWDSDLPNPYDGPTP